MNVDEKKLRNLVIALLDDDHGITESAYHALLGVLPDELYNEIVLRVRTCEDRVYLPKESVTWW
jgi:hypothetical protein